MQWHPIYLDDRGTIRLLADMRRIAPETIAHIHGTANSGLHKTGRGLDARRRTHVRLDELTSRARMESAGHSLLQQAKPATGPAQPARDRDDIPWTPRGTAELSVRACA